MKDILYRRRIIERDSAEGELAMPVEEKNHGAHGAHGGVLLEPLTEAIIGAAIEVHRELGPGLLESTYEACLAHELSIRGLRVVRQLPLPVTYKGVKLDCGYRVDLLVEDQVVLELKAVEHLEAVHEAQLLSYLKLSGHRVGLLLNFNVKALKNGLKRMVL